MKNRYGLCFLSCLFSLSLLILLLGAGQKAVYAQTYQYTIEAGAYQIVDAGDGYQEIQMEGFGQILDPGKPKLPSKIFHIAIPPGVGIDSVEAVGVRLTELEGTYRIVPAPMVSALSATGAQVEETRADYESIVEEAYASDSPYPEKEGVFKQQGAYRKYNLVQVRYSPFIYEAKSGRLFFYPQLIVTVDYSYSSEVAVEADTMAYDYVPEAEQTAREFILNYQDAQRWYPAPVDAPANSGGFVIITTDALEDSVWPIKNWETCKGRVVHVKTVEDINTSYSGVDLAEKIRNFLRAYLSSWGILKVMLIGDISDVPMRYTYPNGPDGPDDDTTPWQLEDRVPTDYYYAELSLADSASWNSNSDAMYGQRGVDNVQFPNEVDVGRIPWSDPTTVENICMKMVDFEYSTDMSYKLNYLFTGAFFWDDTDNAVVKTYIINHALDTVTYGYPIRIYEQGPCWNSAYWSDYDMDRYITREVWGNDYGDGPFGYVNLAGHGSHYGVYFQERHPTCSAQVYFYSPTDCAYLDDSYPSIVFSNACSTAWPEDNNLGKRLLERGAVAFVGSTRTAFGAHGWDEPSDGNCSSLDWLFTDKAARTDGARSSVGWSHQHALRDMYDDYNWDNSWWQFFEWNLYSNPDLWLRDRPTNLPNLDSYYRTGWDYPLVPRSSAGATSTWCPVTSTLPGNTDDTYFNWTCENNGSSDSPSAVWRKYVDGNWMAYTSPSLAEGANTYNSNWNYGPTITGGRHTLYYYLDEDEEVWETSESDNCWGRQFIWSPYALTDDTPIYRSAPCDHDAWACAENVKYYNNDGFSFYVGSAHPNKWWSAVGILPYNMDADYDLRLWDIGDYTGSEQGFGSGYLEWSNNGDGLSNFVIVNDNTATAGTYYAGVINMNDETGNYHIEEATSTKIYNGANGPYSMSSTAVLDIYEYYISPVGTYGFKLEQTAGTCDLGMSLYDDETVQCQKNEYMTGGYADSYGGGEDEYMEVAISDTGYHGLVVWKKDAGDYSKTSTYRIKVGLCTTPGTPSNPFPADGAVDVSVNADLNWGDCTNTEYYEVWLKAGSASWVKLGETETSAWALPTLNQATHYEWFIRAWNICGSSVYVYWDFTTEDNTAPTPDPMTWATEPYELSTSQISMTATTATDPTTPIQYYFDFTGSPTSGGGGSDYGWTTDTVYTDSGLGINHQYGYRVSARDGALNQTSPSAISYEYTDIETPTGITFGTKTSTSIQAKSTNTPSGLTRGSSGLYIYNATAGTSSGWKQDNNYWTSSGLHPNTQYGFRAIARNGDGNNTGWSSTSYTYTLANKPIAAIFTNITQTSIQANWTANGNPAGTEYYCQNITQGTGSGWTTATSWNSTGLTCDTSYTFQVRARNAEGIVTDWVSLGSQSTLACDAPVIDSIDVDGCISELCTSAISVTAHDPAGGTLTYVWTPLNGGAILGSGPDVTFDPPNAGPHPCPYQVRVTVTSSNSGLSTSTDIDITVKLAGDVDGSGSVNALDRIYVRNAFGSVPGDTNWDPRADVDCSGSVNALDRIYVRNQFGDTGCGCPE